MGASTEEMPQSVEEAGALLGAAITRYGSPGAFNLISPPKGTHSSFSAISPVPSSELLICLHSLRALLRSAPKDTPLVAAPSLLAGVLMKLLGISNNLASSTNADPTRRTATPPMLSTPLRKLWVDCVVLCHTLGEGLSGNTRINIYGFVRNMISLASMNPRMAKAAGGTRVAAIEVIGALMEDEKLSKQLSSWALDVIHLSQRALKSSGTGGPTYRIASVRTASSAAIACREAFIKTRPLEGTARLVLKGALEDRAILDMVKLLRVATNDKFPEVRSAAATLASLLAPLVIHTHVKSSSSPDAAAASPTASLEDMMTIAIQNLDDKSPEVAAGWAEALARCMSTSIEFRKQASAEKASHRDASGAGDSPSKTPRQEQANRLARKGVVSASVCSTLPNTLKYLVKMYVKVGGELVAPRAGGSFSTGGRAVRVGFARTLTQLLRIQSSLNAIGEGRSISHKEAIKIILTMVGKDMETQLSSNDKSSATPFPESLDATSIITPTTVFDGASSTVFGQPASNPLFGVQGPKVSPADGGIVCLAASRVLRDGISNLALESTQIAILHELIGLCNQEPEALQANQLQVVLTEISHLFTALGEASATAIDDLLPALANCLRNPNHGVRYEAVVACAAMSSVFPSHGRQIVQDCICAIRLEHAELMALASTKKADGPPETGSAARRFRFGRVTPVKEVKVDESLKHQFAIHGMALMVSVVIRDLPNLPGGLPMEVLDTVILVAHVLVDTLFNNIVTAGNPSGACTCARAGFGLICGALAAGPRAVTKHIALIFDSWKKMSNPSPRNRKFSADHELMCVESMLSSVVVFLKNCSELLLSIPDALSKTSLVLEQLLPLFFKNGKFGNIPTNPIAASRLDSAKASLMEAFSWLPPGSYPMVADAVFSFAAGHIQNASQCDVPCSILGSLVSKEDMILDSMTFSRATLADEVGDARDLGNDIIARTAEPADYGDREAVSHFFGGSKKCRPSVSEFLGSQVLGMICDDRKEKPPTVLHEVGTWRTPVIPSCSSTIRLVDAAIQAFAATFGLKSGKEQQRAMQMLASLVPSASYLAEQEKRTQAKEANASLVNITATVLSCLKTLPIQESTHNVPIGLGPSWMNKAKDVFLVVLPSPSHAVRRAAAEGLAFLATLGVKEDAHFLQSSVLHSLDEVMKGNHHSHGQARVSAESLSAARTGAVLTLGCMQRAAHRIKKERAARARIRGSSPSEESKEANNEDVLPTIQMMTRILPSIVFRPSGGLFAVRTYGIHAFGLLFAYSSRLNGSLTAENRHLLRKMVELVEDNFAASWTVASSDFDHGNEAEKLASEASFLAVILRLMTFLVPYLHHLESVDSGIAVRFSRMATLIMECCSSHPVVQMEVMAFYEMLAAHQRLLPAHTGGIKYDEHPVLCCVPFLMSNIGPSRIVDHPSGHWNRSRGSLSSSSCLRATLKVIRALSVSQVLIAEWSDMRIVSLLFAALEDTIGTRVFAGETSHRGLAAPRESEITYNGGNQTVQEITEVVRLLLYLERSLSKNCDYVLLRYILLSRCILIGNSSTDDDGDEETEEPYTVVRVVQAALGRAASDASPVLHYANPVRWQVKSLAVQVATIAIDEMVKKCGKDGLRTPSSPMFNPKLANSECLKECRRANSSQSTIPESKLALHINALVAAACNTATATVDQVELRSLQECAMHMLVKTIYCFGSMQDPDQPDLKVLHEYIPQISSCIKSALGAPNEADGEYTCRLFLVGCEALREFVCVTTEKGVLKRLARAAVPSSDEMPFFEYNSGVPSKVSKVDGSKMNANMRASLLLRIGKLWTLENIPLEDTEIKSLVEVDESEIGAHAAALAIDGASLLLSSGYSLCGSKINQDQSQNGPVESGFFYDHITDIDDSVKAALVEKWASFASLAVTSLSKTISETDLPSERRDACEVWLCKIIPFLFAGLHDSISYQTSSSTRDKTDDWARQLDSNNVASRCLQGLNTVVSTPGLLDLDEKWKPEIESSTGRLSKQILLPILSSKFGSNPRNTGTSAELIAKSCSLLESLAKNPVFGLHEDSSLLLFLLQPLNMLQSSSINLGDSHVTMIISACLVSVADIISKLNTPDSLVKAMVSLVLTVSAREKEMIPDSIKTAIQALLRECLSNNSLTTKEQCAIATEMANARDWGTWSVVVQANDGISARNSLLVIQRILQDSSLPNQQLGLLAALRVLLQHVTPSDFAGRVVCAIGAEIITVFQSYGTLSVALPAKEAETHRTAACADCMKIVLLAYQQFSSGACDDDEMATFLVVVFQSFISVIRYNGLPNHPLPQAASDPAVGRMCAQAITHIARTTPLPFKSSMSKLSEHNRTVLEFAVRAEMSGYVTAAAQAPVKKKLNLKSFKK